jgi:Asp-tRNA(Asn)/Glu-tRNA(Gln) amidotransferase A subunit family amidase
MKITSLAFAFSTEDFLSRGKLEGLFDLTRAILSRDLHPQHYIQLLKARYEALEPRVQSLVPAEENPFERLEREVHRLQESPSEKGDLPLFCVPFGLKDTFHAQGFLTRAGSLLPPHVLTGEEGPLVKKLRGLGALILGKTHTAEFAYLAPPPTRNPHDPSRTPGGSSSGSAASVAYGLCPIAIGTQTVGSIIKSAAFCGIFGFKPSFGRVPTEGSIPLSPSLDQVGFFTRDVEGMELAASVLVENWSSCGNAGELVLGVPEGPYLRWAGPQAMENLGLALSRLKECGLKIAEVKVLENFQEITLRHRRLMAAEAAQVHREWFSEFRSLYRPQTLSLIERGTSVSDSEVEVYREGRAILREILMEIMEEKGLTAWISPATVGPAPMGLSNTGESTMNLPWTYAGLPAISLPFGKSREGLPMGIQLVGRWMKDEELLALAKVLWAFLRA